MKHKLSVVMPFCNEYPQVIFTVQAVAQSLLGRVDFELIAINNYCEEVKAQNREQDKGGETIRVCQRGNPWLKYLEYTDKLSHWQSKNLGVKSSTGDVLWFVDAHCAVSRDAIYDMFNYYVENKDKLNGSLHLPLTYKILEWHRLIYKLAGEIEQGNLHYSFTGYRAEKEPYEVPCMSTCGMMISRELYDLLGGWPKELGIYGGGENFINYTLAVLGKSKYIMTGGGTLFHHGEKRGYHWNGDDMIRNRFIANYMFGGDKWLSLMKEHRKGKKEVLQNIYEDVKTTCSKHRQLIKSQQVISIEEWLRKWR